MYKNDFKGMFFDQNVIAKFEAEIVNKLDYHNYYMPKFKVVGLTDFENTLGELKDEYKEKLEQNIVEID